MYSKCHQRIYVHALTVLLIINERNYARRTPTSSRPFRLQLGHSDFNPPPQKPGSSTDIELQLPRWRAAAFRLHSLVLSLQLHVRIGRTDGRIDGQANGLRNAASITPFPLKAIINFRPRRQHVNAASWVVFWRCVIDKRDWPASSIYFVCLLLFIHQCPRSEACKCGGWFRPSICVHFRTIIFKN